MDFNLYNSIILAGIIQGLIFGLVVFLSPKYRVASTLLLGALIVVFSLNNIQYYLGDAGLITSAQLFGVLFLPYQLLSGPILLLYGLKLIYPHRQFSKKLLWMFVPFAIGVAISTFYKLNYLNGTVSDGLARFCMAMSNLMEFFSILFDQVIVLWLLREISVYARRTTMSYPNSEIRPELGWFKTILRTFFALSFVWLFVTLTTYKGSSGEKLWYVMWIAVSFMIYWLGHVGIYKFGVMEQRRKIREFSMSHSAVPMTGKQRNEHVEAFTRLVVDRRMFLDPDLTLDKVADELHLSKSHLSRMINAELNISFPDFINTLRVEEAKSYLTQPEFSNYTLVAIGLEAGFASKTTFNSAFKKITGMTPSEFKHSATDFQTLQKPFA